MSDYPPIWVMLTTYRRTEMALRTVRAIKQNLIYPNLGWYISDDGTDDPNHINSILEEIGSEYQKHTYNSARKGVGHGMNYVLQNVFEHYGHLVLSMEDDWELNRPVEFVPYVKTLMDHPEHGMIRFGYLSPNLLGYNISEEGKLFWRLDNNGETYRYAGHPHLKHLRFHEFYGYFDEGLTPGMTELSMCGKTNAKPGGPNILYPCDCGQWGFFGHIGADSLADVEPNR